jgi:hypothetical protein
MYVYVTPYGLDNSVFVTGATINGVASGGVGAMAPGVSAFVSDNN